MKLHEFPNAFRDLISIVSADKHLPESTIERDYYIVLLLQKLANSEYAERCVFKGGTSLSKCYPGSIERFSEDIDLTYLGEEGMSDKQYSKNIKNIESLMTLGFQTEKIEAERNNRNKSMQVWMFDKKDGIKLEIGSQIRPDPYSKKILKTYIQEFLETHGGEDDVIKYDLEEVSLNVLDITRTFLDKIMSVKRHAICGTIEKKVRHIYDVTRLFYKPEIKAFLSDKENLRNLVSVTKQTDAYYLGKRNIPKSYDPSGLYNFECWKHSLNSNVRLAYESLHKELLYTDIQQDFDEALSVFSKISKILSDIGE